MFVFNINIGSRARLNGSWKYIERDEAVNEVKRSLLRGCCDQEEINMMDWTYPPVLKNGNYEVYR